MNLSAPSYNETSRNVAGDQIILGLLIDPSFTLAQICKKEDVCERLTQHGWVDASNIEVDVEDGVVQLRGEVDGRRRKRLAEDTAGSVTGIHDVMNYLTIPREDDV